MPSLCIIVAGPHTGQSVAPSPTDHQVLLRTQDGLDVCYVRRGFGHVYDAAQDVFLMEELFVPATMAQDVAGAYITHYLGRSGSHPPGRTAAARPATA